MRWYFAFFCVSGFCSVLYEVIWLRLSMADFGVTTILVSIVLSVFMAGLGLGSWGSGYLIRKYGNQITFPPLRLYALTELLIGVSAVTVPHQLSLGRALLGQIIIHMSSPGYYLSSGIWIALTLVPWCACMGATFPFAMLAIRDQFFSDDNRSFSYLYLANVLGAVAGATVPLFLIELVGFRHTLWVGAAFNLALASCAFVLTLGRHRASRSVSAVAPQRQVPSVIGAERLKLWILFGTGLTSMGVEVIWIRLYTPSLSTVVYAFAAILALYLVATDLGSWMYRRWHGQIPFESGLMWTALGFSVLFAFLTADPRWSLPPLLRVILGVAPLSGLVGFVTPMMVDQYSFGDPDRAGRAYAINIVGCVAGPLLSGFVLLPTVGERFGLCVFALPWLIAGCLANPLVSRLKWSPAAAVSSILILGSLAMAISTEGYEQQFTPRQVRRDSMATIVATGSERPNKRLLINGVGITSLTPITKMMVHLPNAFLPRPPQNGLVICFGMGTTHLSMLSWGIASTVVELVPSVPEVVTFYHPQAALLMKSPRSHVVIDDGRSFLERSSEQYDVITIDPPPPVPAAGSSLLYSKEFYAMARRHLRTGGILQQWFPDGDEATTASVARAIKESFPHVRAFKSVEGWGTHFLASMSPVANRSASELAVKLPADAARDLMEWGPTSSPQEQFQVVLDHEVSLDAWIQQDPNSPALQDDHPVNEYFILRRLRNPASLRTVWSRLLQGKLR
jgi:spermidine synthase